MYVMSSGTAAVDYQISYYSGSLFVQFPDQQSHTRIELVALS